MFLKKQLLFLTAILFVSACSSTKNATEKTVFPFQYQDNDYEIISIITPAGDGANMLIHYANDQIQFRCRDNDMDGRLDFVFQGEVSLNEANQIYEYGIREAIKQGKFKTQDTVRKYEYELEKSTYIIQTYGLFLDKIYNEFTIIDPSGKTIAILLDLNADGTLDAVKFGDFSLDDTQVLYDKVLETGLNENQIITGNGKIVVKRANPE